MRRTVCVALVQCRVLRHGNFKDLGMQTICMRRTCAMMLKGSRQLARAAPLTRRHVEAGAECLVEVREVVEAPTIGNLGDAGVTLMGIAKRLAAGFEAGGEPP